MHLFYLPIIGVLKTPQFFCHLTDTAWLPHQKNKNGNIVWCSMASYRTVKQ